MVRVVVLGECALELPPSAVSHLNHSGIFSVDGIVVTATLDEWLNRQVDAEPALIVFRSVGKVSENTVIAQLIKTACSSAKIVMTVDVDDRRVAPEGGGARLLDRFLMLIFHITNPIWQLVPQMEQIL